MTSLDLKHHLLCILFGICIPPFINSSQDASFRPVYEWSQLEFDYPSEQARQQDISSGNFIPGVAAPIDVDVYYSKNNGNNKIFVSIPRFQAGIPVALATISDKKRDGNPVLTPYPSWQWYQNSKRCPRNRIVSVYRTQIDECDRLWVLDNGRLVDDLICPPQLLVFDLQTDQLLLQYEIPSGQREPRSTLVTPVVDIRNGKCSEAFAYLADCQTFSIIVFDLKRRTSWQISDKTMYPYPNYGTYSIAGNSFDLMDGILGATLSPYSPNEDRKLFYHAMSSPTENWVYTSLIRNQTRFQDNPESSPEIFHTYKGQRNTQSAAEATDKDGIMFFGEMSDITLNCWNTRTPYDPQNIHVVASNRKTLQFISGLKIITNRKGTQEIWAMASRFQKVADGTLNANEVNFRIHAGKVEDLLYGSKCRDGASSNSWSGGQGYGLRPRPDQKS